MQISGLVSDVPVVFSSIRGCNSKHFHFFPYSKSSLFLTIPRGHPSFCFRKMEIESEQLRSRNYAIKASRNTNGDLVPIAPVKLESPVGLFLSELLHNHPHLLPAALDKQLENLEDERDAQTNKPPQSSHDLLLYKRIAEVKEKERRKAVEDIIYCMVVHKFIENHISMIPKISQTSHPSERVDFWPNQGKQLESVHSPEVFEMILSHLSLVLGNRAAVPSLDILVQISKIKLGKLYAASVMYGYFLRRVDERFQLERSMNTLPEEYMKEEPPRFQAPTPDKQLWDPESLIVIPTDDDEDEEGEDYRGSGLIMDSDKPYELRSYVMHLDVETLERYVTVRSKEAMSLIEKQTQALFGRPDITIADDGSLDTSNDEIISLSLSGLTLLVLEAVSFGSFLWDAEGYVETKYQFMKN